MLKKGVQGGIKGLLDGRKKGDDCLMIIGGREMLNGGGRGFNKRVKEGNRYPRRMKGSL